MRPSVGPTNDNQYQNLRSNDRVSSAEYVPQVQGSRAPSAVAFNRADTLPNDTGTQLDLERQRDLEEEQSGAELSYAARGQGDSNSGTPFYTGKD